MGDTGYVILFFVGIIVVTLLYYWIKRKAKQNIFFKDQYEMQKNLTENSEVQLQTQQTTNVSYPKISPQQYMAMKGVSFGKKYNDYGLAFYCTESLDRLQ